MRIQFSQMVAATVILASVINGPVVSSQADETVRGRSIDTWLSMLRDRRSTKRELAIEALSVVGAKDKRVVPALAAVATDRDCGWCAIMALGALGKDARQAAPVLNTIMSQAVDVRLRITAAEALWQIARDQKVVPALAAVATDREYGGFAISSLGMLGEDAREAAPTLNAIMSQDARVLRRIVAAEALWQIARQPACIDVLIQFLDDHDRENRAGAVIVLGRIGPPAKKAIPKLLGLLGDDELVRIRAAEVLGQIHSEPWSVVPALIKALRDPSAPLRHQAAIALAQFGKEAANAIPALEQATKDIDSTLRVEAAYALWCIDKRPDAVRRLHSAVVRFEPDEDEVASYTALRRLGEIGRDNEEVAPLLMELVNRGHPHSIDIATVLWDLNRRAEALAVLSASLEDKEFVNRRAAADSLAILGPDAKNAAPALVKAIARQPNDEQLDPEQAIDDPPALVEPNTRSLFDSCRSAAWRALQAVDPATASRYQSEQPELIQSLEPNNDPATLKPLPGEPLKLPSP